MAGRGEDALDEGRVVGRDVGRDAAPVARGDEAREDPRDEASAGLFRAPPSRGDDSREAARDVDACEAAREVPLPPNVRGEGLREELRE